MLPILHIGPLTIPTSGIIYILGLWVGLSFAEKHSKRRGIEASALYNLVLVSLLVGIIAARLVYVARYPSSFLADPLSIVLPNPNMLDLPGGLAGGSLAALIYANRKKLGFYQTLDALTPALAIMAISASLANLSSGNAYGSLTDLPWSIELWGAKRHPAQLYEMLGACLTLFVMWPARPWLDMLKPGGVFWAFLALSSFSRLFLEAFRGDSIILLDHYRGMQILALAILMVSLWFLGKNLPDSRKSELSGNGLAI